MTLPLLALLVHSLAPFLTVAGLGLWWAACSRLGLLHEAHHVWYGVALALPAQHPWPVRLLGLVVLWDDALGHLWELFPGNRGKRSPLHRLVYRIFPHLP